MNGMCGSAGVLSVLRCAVPSTVVYNEIKNRTERQRSGNCEEGKAWQDRTHGDKDGLGRHTDTAS